METVTALNSAPVCTSLSPSAAIWQDVLAQAMTGELLAAMNYASLAEICDDPAEVADALEHFRKRPALGFSDCLVLEIARNPHDRIEDLPPDKSRAH